MAMGNEHGCVSGRSTNLLDCVEVLCQHHHVQHILGGRIWDILGESKNGFAQTVDNSLQEKGPRETMRCLTIKIIKITNDNDDYITKDYYYINVMRHTGV